MGLLKLVLANMVISLAIALSAIALLIMPPMVFVDTWPGDGYFIAPPATTNEGLAIRGEVWKKYPDRTAGLVAIMVMGFLSAACSAQAAYTIREVFLEK